MKTTVQKGSGRHPEAGVIALGIRKCRFFGADQAVAWVIGAYGDALRDMHPPEGEPWLENGLPWATPCSFADAFEHHFERRMADRFLSALGWPGEGGPAPMCFRALPVSSGSNGALSELVGDAESDPELLHPQMPELPQCGTVPVVSDQVEGGSDA